VKIYVAAVDDDDDDDERGELGFPMQCHSEHKCSAMAYH